MSKYLKLFYWIVGIGSIISLGVIGTTALVIYLAHPTEKPKYPSYSSDISFEKNSQELQELIESSELVECTESICNFVNSVSSDKIIKDVPDGKYIVFVNSNFTDEIKNKYHDDLIDFWLAFNQLNK